MTKQDTHDKVEARGATLSWYQLSGILYVREPYPRPALMHCCGGASKPMADSHCGSWLLLPLASTTRLASTSSPPFSWTPAPDK